MKKKERQWMYERWEIRNKVKYPTEKFLKGVGEFMSSAKEQQEYKIEKKLKYP